jgi:hypothetical protein
VLERSWSTRKVIIKKRKNCCKLLANRRSEGPKARRSEGGERREKLEYHRQNRSYGDERDKNKNRNRNKKYEE